MKLINQNRKNLIIAVILFIVIYAASAIHGLAEKSSISSKGNMILQTGDKAAFYAEDVKYLQEELNKLFNEIN